MFSIGTVNLLVDTGPELRLQCLSNKIRHVDAILTTHHHADHIVGLDDVRRFNWLQQQRITLYGNRETLAQIRLMFRYAFEDDPEYPSAKPQLEASVVTGPTTIRGCEVIPIPYFHGPIPVLGFRVGNIAYCPDCNRIPEESRDLLRNLDILVLDALRRRAHPTHFNLDQAIEEARRIGAKRTYFTHIAHELPHKATNDQLPNGMELAYDGLVLESVG